MTFLKYQRAIRNTKINSYACIIAGALLLPGGSAFAQDTTKNAPENTETVKFMGQTIIVAPGTYVVRTDVNIRATPDKSGKRLGKFAGGAVIEVAGQVLKSGWFATYDDGAPAGFVFGSVLSPIIDGRVDENVTGKVRVEPDIGCGFDIVFLGKTGGEAGLIRTADYEAAIVCTRKGLQVRFPAQMFITEEPFDGSRKQRIFQINVDLLDGLHDLDDIFSTITLFDQDKARVRFDGASEATFISAQDQDPTRPAKNVSEALSAALQIALMVWSLVVWDKIFEPAG